MIAPCHLLLKHELFHMCFSMILLTFQEHLFKETSLNGCFRLLQQRGFTRELYAYFPGKHCYQEFSHLNVKIPHSKLFHGQYLLPRGSTYLLVNKYWGSSYFPVNIQWVVLFTWEYLLKVKATASFFEFYEVSQQIIKEKIKLESQQLTC